MPASDPRVIQSPNYTRERVRGTLTNSAASLLANASGESYAIDRIIFTDIDATARTVTLREETTGSVVGTSAQDIMTAVDILAGEVLIFEGNGGDDPFYVLETGTELYGLASANSAINYCIEYRSFTR